MLPLSAWPSPPCLEADGRQRTDRHSDHTWRWCSCITRIDVSCSRQNWKAISRVYTRDRSLGWRLAGMCGLYVLMITVTVSCAMIYYGADFYGQLPRVITVTDITYCCFFCHYYHHAIVFIISSFVTCGLHFCRRLWAYYCVRRRRLITFQAIPFLFVTSLSWFPFPFRAPSLSRSGPLKSIYEICERTLKATQRGPDEWIHGLNMLKT